MGLIRIGYISSDIARYKGNIRSRLITSKVERSDLGLVFRMKFGMSGIVILLYEFDIFIKRRFDWYSLTEAVFGDNLVDVLFLVDVNFSRFLLYMYSQILGVLSLVGY
jgi:hypothetical protein